MSAPGLRVFVAGCAAALLLAPALVAETVPAAGTSPRAQSEAVARAAAHEVRAALAKMRGGTARPEALAAPLEALAHAVAPARPDASWRDVPSEALVALWAGARELSGPRGAALRRRALALLQPPELRPVYLPPTGGTPLLLRGDSRFRELCLTFDDGPCRHTARLLDVLARHSVRATFFTEGQNLELNAALVRRLRLAGHQLGCHGYAHVRFTGLDDEHIHRQAYAWKQALRAVLGEEYPCRYLRLPFNSGARDARVNRAVGRDFACVVDWSIDSRDWERPRVDALILDRVVLYPWKRGGIVLMHENCKDAGVARRVDVLLDRLEALGYRLVTLDELLGRDEGTLVRRGLAKALSAVEAGRIAEGLAEVAALAREHPTAPEAGDARYLASELARSLEVGGDLTSPLKLRR